MGGIGKKICLILLLVAIGTNGSMYASDHHTRKSTENQQQKGITGTVSDDLGPVVGATVAIKGTTIGTITDQDGRFTLNNVPDDATIEVSFIGYLKQEIKYTGQTILDILLQEDSKMLEEVVVTAMGIKKEKRALSYAMNELKADELRTVPTQDISSSLYGKAAGVRIAGTAGGPTGGSKIQIRGINSIEGNNRPLIVLNGVPMYDNDSNWAGRDRDQTLQGSALNDINPDDIETMSILKGANASALYGSRAANGVILITTKKGAMQKGLGVDVATSFTFDQMAYMPEYQNVFGQGSKPFFSTSPSGKETLEWNTTLNFGPRMDGRMIEWWDGVERPYSPQKDNYKDLFRNGYTNNNSVSISNGTENANVRFSYANNNYQGFLDNFKQTKHNFNLSGMMKLSNRITIDASISYNRTEKENEPTRIDRVSNFPMPRSEKSSMWKDNYKNADGYFLGNGMSSLASGIKDNVLNYLLWQQNENEYTFDRDRFMGTLTANVKIIEPLNLRVLVGTDRIRDLKQDKEMFKEYADPADMNNLQGLYRKANEDYTKNYMDLMLSFNKELSTDFTLSAMAGASFEDISESGNTWRSQGLRYNGMFSTNNNKKDPKTAARDFGYNRSEAMNAVFGSAQLAFRHYLYLDVTARNDWSSRLPKEDRSFFYPSVGVGFVFSDAMKQKPSWLDYGKVRASYAVVGNATPSIYFANNKFEISTYNGSVLMNQFGSEVPPTVIVPEKSYSWEIGLELKTLDNRLGMDLAYFSNEVRNQIISLSVAPSSGASKYKTNAGTLGNSGVELQLTGVPVQTKDFSWNTTLNFSYTKNEVKKFALGLQEFEIGRPWSAAIFKSAPGHSAYGVYIQKWKRDDKGNMLVDANGKYTQDSEWSYMGDAMPKYNAGLTNTFRYKDFSLTAHIDAQFGGKILSFTNNYLRSSGAGKESLFGRDEEYGGLPYYLYEVTGADGKKTTYAKQLDSHSASVPSDSKDGILYHDGMIAKGVKADGSENTTVLSAKDYYDMRYNKAGSEDNLYDNTYVKLRELSITYQLPRKVYSRIGLQGLSVSLIGSNLFYIYKNVPNIDPEATLGTSGTNAYVEYTAYPTTRSYGISLKAKF